MKLIIAVIQPSRLHELRQVLTENNVSGMTVTQVRGFGRQKGDTEIYRGTRYHMEFTDKVKVEIVISENRMDEIIKLISDTVRTGKIGDGKIFVQPIEEVIRLRTGESGEGAL